MVMGSQMSTIRTKWEKRQGDRYTQCILVFHAPRIMDCVPVLFAVFCMDIRLCS